MSVIPLHTRFRFAPTGDVHVGHAVLCWLSYNAARQTGGTFVYRTEQLKAYVEDSRRESFRRFVRRNIEDLCSLGLVPTDGRVLESFDGMDASFRIQIVDDRGLCDYYWRILGYERMFGPWPVQFVPDQGDTGWKSFIYGVYEQGWTHPYILLAQTVGDIVTGRNCLIRGMDLRFEAAMINAMAQQVARVHHGINEVDHFAARTFTQHYIPLIKRSGTRLPPEMRDPNGVPLHASQPDVTNPFYIRVVLDSGVTPEELFKFMGRVLFGSTDASLAAMNEWANPVIDRGFTSGCLPIPGTGYDVSETTHARVYEIISRMVPNPIIDDDEWFEFLRTGRSE